LFEIWSPPDKPVTDELLKTIFTQAQLSPSNCNVQPWQIHVVSGTAKDTLKDKLLEAVMSGQEPNPEVRCLRRNIDKGYGCCPEAVAEFV